MRDGVGEVEWAVGGSSFNTRFSFVPPSCQCWALRAAGGRLAPTTLQNVDSSACFRGFSGQLLSAAPVFPEFVEISYLLLRIPTPHLPFIVISLFPFPLPKSLLNGLGGKSPDSRETNFELFRIKCWAPQPFPQPPLIFINFLQSCNEVHIIIIPI